jgi:hypothetical protein
MSYLDRYCFIIIWPSLCQKIAQQTGSVSMVTYYCTQHYLFCLTQILFLFCILCYKFCFFKSTKCPYTIIKTTTKMPAGVVASVCSPYLFLYSLPEGRCSPLPPRFQTECVYQIIKRGSYTSLIIKLFSSLSAFCMSSCIFSKKWQKN